MKDTRTILLTGAGGAAIPFLVQSLKSHGYRVLTADMDPYAAGLFIGDKGFVIPKADAPGFSRSIQKICSTESVDIVIPLVDEELLAVSQLGLKDTIPLLPNADFIRTCLDKYTLIRELNRHHIPAPHTLLANAGPGDMEFPCIVKPRTGRGSRDVELLRTKTDYYAWVLRTGDTTGSYILQEFIPGTEYTVSVVAWKDGKVQAVVPKQIIVKKGITRLAITRHHQAIEEYCASIQKYLKADGPFNVQLRCDENANNPLLFEINPRYSTTVSLTIMAGIDELHGLILQALDGSDAYRFGEWKDGIILMRQNQDLCVNSQTFETMNRNIRNMV
jgi:carbamoyl-phosphate synthase large subunit